jgi:hypothetical protein
VVQETVAHLGELDGEGRARARLLAQQITGGSEQHELFEETATGEQTVAVRLKGLRVERTRSFGDVWLGWTLWRALRLEERCAELLPAGREAVPWAQMAAVLVIARLCEPSSELHIAEDWYRKTALEDLLGLPAERIDDNRLYRALDRLLPHKAAIEQHLRTRLGELFALEYDLLLYDVTSTYFEGLAELNTLATAATTAPTASRSVSRWWSRARGCRWATSSSPGIAPTSLPSRRSSPRWKRATGWPTGSGSWTAG